MKWKFDRYEIPTMIEWKMNDKNYLEKDYLRN